MDEHRQTSRLPPVDGDVHERIRTLEKRLSSLEAAKIEEPIELDFPIEVVPAASPTVPSGGLKPDGACDHKGRGLYWCRSCWPSPDEMRWHLLAAEVALSSYRIMLACSGINGRVWNPRVYLWAEERALKTDPGGPLEYPKALEMAKNLGGPA